MSEPTPLDLDAIEARKRALVSAADDMGQAADLADALGNSRMNPTTRTVRATVEQMRATTADVQGLLTRVRSLEALAQQVALVVYLDGCNDVDGPFMEAFDGMAAQVRALGVLPANPIVAALSTAHIPQLGDLGGD